MGSGAHEQREMLQAMTVDNMNRCLYFIQGQLQVYKHLVHRLAVLLIGFVGCGVTDGDEHDGLEGIGNTEELTAESDIEVAHPTSTQALLSSSEAKVLHGDADIDIGMVFGL